MIIFTLFALVTLLVALGVIWWRYTRSPVILSPDRALFINGKYVWSQERVKEAWEKFWPELERLLKKGSRKIVVLQGPPASGKSTWLRDNAANLSGCIVLDATFTGLWYFKRMAKRAGESGHQHTFRVIRFRTPYKTRLGLDQNRADDPTSGRDEVVPLNIHQNMEKQNSNLTDAMIKEVLSGCEIVEIQFVDNTSDGGAKAD